MEPRLPYMHLIFLVCLIGNTTGKTTETREIIGKIRSDDYKVISITQAAKIPGNDYRTSIVQMVAPDDAEFPFFSINKIRKFKGATNGENDSTYVLKYDYVIDALVIHVKSQAKSTSFLTVVSTNNLKQNGTTAIHLNNCQLEVLKISVRLKVRYEIIDNCGQWPLPGYKKYGYFLATITVPGSDRQTYAYTKGLYKGLYEKWRQYFGIYDDVPKANDADTVSAFIDYGEVAERGIEIKSMNCYMKFQGDFGYDVFDKIELGIRIS